MRRSTNTMREMALRKVSIAAVVVLLTRGALAEDAVKIAVTGQGVSSLAYQGVEYCDPAGCGAVGFSGGGAGIQDTRNNP